MKTKITLVLLTLALLFNVAASQAPSSRVIWEYKFEYGLNQKKANDLGAQGWELAAIESTSNAGMGNNVPVYVFKRAKS